MSDQADRCVNESCDAQANCLVDSELYREPLPMCGAHAGRFTQQMPDLEVIAYV